MYSYEFVRKEMERRGVPTQAMRASAIPVVIDIVANTDRNWTDYAEALKELEHREQCVSIDERIAKSRVEREAEKLKEEALRETRQARALFEKLIKMRDEICGWHSELKQCETAEARDKVRLAYIFQNATRFARNDADFQRVSDRFLGFLLGEFEETLDRRIAAKIEEVYKR